jgi:uncharacterized phiE125 gp8 family phage protein
VRLPLFPVQSITSIRYWDSANADTLFPADNYGLYADALGAGVYLKQGVSWPSVYSRPDAVRITFVAGYGATPESVPAPFRTAVKMAVEMNYDTTADRKFLQERIDAILKPYRRPGL